MMFWRDAGASGSRRELNGGPPCGQVRVLVVGDSGQLFLSRFRAKSLCSSLLA
jgi:hypothetical protein